MKNLNTKEKRLLIEVVRQHIPLRHCDNDILSAWIKDEMNFDIQTEEIDRIAPFKQFLFSRVVGGVKNVANGKQKQILVKRVRRDHS